MRLKSSNSLFRTFLWLACIWFIASAQEVVLLYGAEDSERETIILKFVDKSGEPISEMNVVAVGPVDLGTTDKDGKLNIKPSKVQRETLILKCKKDGYLERTKILRLTDKTKEFTQTINLEPESSTTTEEVITLRIPKGKISELSSDKPEAISLEVTGDELKKKIRELLSGGSNKIEVFISLEGDKLAAKMLLEPIRKEEARTYSGTPQQVEASVTSTQGKTDTSPGDKDKEKPPSARLSPSSELKVIDDINNKIPDADVKVNGISQGKTDKDGKLLFDPPEKAEKIKIEVFKEGYEQVSHLEEIDPKSEQFPLEIKLKRLPTVNLTLQVRYQEKLLFSTETQLDFTTLKNPPPDDLRKEFENNGISLSSQATITLGDNKKHRIEDNGRTYVFRQRQGQLNIYEEGETVDNAVVQINGGEPKETNKDGCVTFPGVSVPTAGKLGITVSKGLMRKKENIVPNKQDNTVILIPEKWIEIKVFSKKAEPLPNTTIMVDGNTVGETDQYGRLIIPVGFSELPKEYSITAEHPDYKMVKPTMLTIQRDRKVYPRNITLE